jgi:hypothetical protein
VIHPLLTAYLDAFEVYAATPNAATAAKVRQAGDEWEAANRPRLADDSTFLTALRGDLTAGPHISPDAPPEVWGAWRDLNNLEP